MRMVYTLWTRPSAFCRDDAVRWCLSTYYANLHGYKVELYTDTNGANILKGLGLEFDKVHIVFDDFISIDPTYWAAGKILTYSLQEEPFCHLDDDVFLFKPLPEEFLASPLFAQCPERSEDRVKDYRYCRSVHNDEDADRVMLSFDDWDCYNAGLLGGSDLEFIHEYANTSLNWMQDMTAKNTVHRPGMVMAEQTLFAKLAREKGKTVTCLLDRHTNDELCAELGYTHLVNKKSWPQMKKRIMRRLKQDAPGYWNNLKHYYASTI